MSYLPHLRSFLAVFRHNSISRAATQLQLTQPAVSRHIKILESRLKTPLFVRLPRGLSPTPAAAELERQAAPHLDALEALLENGVTSRGALAGIVHVGTSSGFSSLLLAALSPVTAHGIRLDIHALPPPGLLAALSEGKIDLAVCLARIPHAGVEYTLLHEGERLLACSPAWRERLPKSSAPKGLPLIDQQGPVPPLQAYWRDVYGAAADKPAIVVPDFHAAMEAALAGAGLAVLPECLCRQALDSGRLIAVSQPRRAPQFSLYLAHAKGASKGERVDLCRQQLLEAAKRW
ncbi:LysR family transcriptional regulator [Pseudoduganella violaceinigra]|uniref:LysR family transcriptional regulator n=1 Tax=Pseudoduganella violaceinigra TaxID=246602 RepID=UPI0004146DF5|nr:LysR family transcriptional regulator [Pseudoduganella violaceinigra]